MRCFLSLAASLLCVSFALGKEVEFQIDKPDAQSVSLMCECNDWKAQAMTKQSDGTWRVAMTLSPGTYAYKFLVNGSEWILDPANSNRKTSNGIENSAMTVAEAEAASTSTASPSATPTATATPSATVATSTAIASSTLSPTPGEVTTFEVPLSEKRRAYAAHDGNGRLAHARVALAVPNGFDPQRSWPVFVVANTEAYSNIDSLQQLKDATLAEGWMIIAADGIEEEKNKEGSHRWPCIAAAFDYLNAQWPAIKDWPIACGGMSGGAKNSAFLAAEFAHEHHRVVGMLMMGCNQDMATVAYRKSAPPNFLSAAVFLSSGKNDKIATPSQTEYVKNSLKGTGFQKVRLESHDGAHDIFQPHVGEALRWFMAGSSNTVGAKPSTPANGDWNKFFKKKP